MFVFTYTVYYSAVDDSVASGEKYHVCCGCGSMKVNHVEGRNEHLSPAIENLPHERIELPGILRISISYL